jgi:hypothetical protein
MKKISILFASVLFVHLIWAGNYEFDDDGWMKSTKIAKEQILMVNNIKQEITVVRQ